ncbi:MATE family efflux transporter [Moorena sp. SIOASIH]|uniref:MATE family efflux transporter n=1 Tax=Moorena sp. SIOASIH TaxID=2607817 RepID=UPI0025CE7808|nr:MATE family efflux transporter [Moorena sp. SIOASIH]
MKNYLFLQKYDFLTRFINLTFVNILSGIMVPLATLVSTIFLGHLAEIQYLTGVALAGEIINLFYGLFISLRMSATALTAIAVGQNDREAVLLSGLRHGLLALVIGLAIVLFQYPLGKLGFGLLSADPDTLTSALDYFNARIWSAPATLLRFIIMGWLLGQEKVTSVLIISVVGNALNIIFDYFFIVRWGYGSTGAGISFAISEYITVFIGGIFVCLDLKWSEFKMVIGKVFYFSTFKSTLALNSNLLGANIVLFFVFGLFSYLGVGMGKITYAENALILQLVTLNLFLADALKLSLETVGGTFKGQGQNSKLVPLLWIALGTGIIISILFSITSVLFPQTVFGLFTNHSEITHNIYIYVPWLIVILIASTVAYILMGHFIVLEAGNFVLNSSIIAAVFGFLPTILVMFWFYNNHILLLALSLFFILRIIILAFHIPTTSGGDKRSTKVAV